MKRENVVPGAKAIVKRDKMGDGRQVLLNGHRFLFGEQRPLAVGDHVEILGRPKRDKDGINLVALRLADGTEGQLYYTDVRYALEEA